VDIEDVVYFEMRDELVWAVTGDDRYAIDLTLSTVERRVPPSRFFRSHRSAIVCLDRIRTIEPSGPGTFELLMDHPEEPRVPLARERARLLRELIPFTG
jgi:two-component system, LytTR family, response regulator